MRNGCELYPAKPWPEISSKKMMDAGNRVDFFCSVRFIHLERGSVLRQTNAVMNWDRWCNYGQKRLAAAALLVVAKKKRKLSNPRIRELTYNIVVVYLSLCVLRRKAITIDKWKPMANLYKLHKTANNVLVPWSIFFSRAARSLEICHSSNIKAIGHGSFFVPKKPPCHPRFHTSIAPRPIASIHRDPISFKYYWINQPADGSLWKFIKK